MLDLDTLLFSCRLFHFPIFIETVTIAQNQLVANHTGWRSHHSQCTLSTSTCHDGTQLEHQVAYNRLDSNPLKSLEKSTEGQSLYDDSFINVFFCSVQGSVNLVSFFYIFFKRKLWHQQTSHHLFLFYANIIRYSNSEPNDRSLVYGEVPATGAVRKSTLVVQLCCQITKEKG